MTRTSWRATLNRRGFTLVELTMIVGVLAIMAIIVVPRIQAMEDGAEYRHFRLGVRRIANEAKTLAVSRGEPVSVAYDETEGALSLIVESQDQSIVNLQSLPLGTGVEAVEFVAENAQSTPSEWRLRFYPDGRSDGGGILFQSANQTFFLAADTSGRVRFDDGILPDLSSERWSAGDYEQRQ
ncbi:MAG: hypothetical protein WAO58_05280 [Fimbriimonadaceae bacterium]